PVSRAFYRASQSDPMDLVRRRRFGFSGGSLTAYEDEEFGGAAPGAGQPSRIMLEEIERPRSGPMRDIVATIQPDQDDIVRASADQSLCVQGAPGTGKTAVGLHRVAYLLYAYPGRMLRGGVLVIGPNRAFLSYIRGVLPALGEAWPAADPVRLVLRLLADPAVLASAADGVLDPSEQAAIRWDKAPRGPGSARWTAADAVLIDEASDLIERIPSLAHVVVDEAQDLSPMECRAVSRRCATGSATVLGDLAQATAPAAEASWPRLLAHLGKPEAGL